MNKRDFVLRMQTQQNNIITVVVVVVIIKFGLFHFINKVLKKLILDKI